MPDWRRSAVVSAVVAVLAPLPAQADPYQFVFSANSSQTIRFGSTLLGTILEGVPTTIRGIGDTVAASETTVSGGNTVHTLTLNELTFAGFPLASRVLQHTVTAGGASTLCMAGTCVSLGSAMPAPWWSAPTPLDLVAPPSAVTQVSRTLALQPGGRAVLGSQTTLDIGSGGGTIDYAWMLDNPGTLAPRSLRVLVTPVPEPGTLALVGAALLATAGVARRRIAPG